MVEAPTLKAVTLYHGMGIVSTLTGLFFRDKLIIERTI